MRKILLATTALALLAMGLVSPAPAGGRHGMREASVTYEGPTGIALVGYGAGTCRDAASPANCVLFPTGGGDRWVRIQITDDSGGPVAAIVTQGTADPLAEFCGDTGRDPLRIQPGLRIEISLYEGTCVDGTPSVVTSGSVTATFTRAR